VDGPELEEALGKLWDGAKREYTEDQIRSSMERRKKALVGVLKRLKGKIVDYNVRSSEAKMDIGKDLSSRLIKVTRPHPLDYDVRFGSGFYAQIDFQDKKIEAKLYGTFFHINLIQPMPRKERSIILADFFKSYGIKVEFQESLLQIKEYEGSIRQDKEIIEEMKRRNEESSIEGLDWMKGKTFQLYPDLKFLACRDAINVRREDGFPYSLLYNNEESNIELILYYDQDKPYIEIKKTHYDKEMLCQGEMIKLIKKVLEDLGAKLDLSLIEQHVQKLRDEIFQLNGILINGR
jgi:hypothetical protein